MDALGAAFVPFTAIQGASDLYNGNYREGLFDLATSLPMAGSFSRTLKRTGGLLHRNEGDVTKGLAKYFTNPKIKDGLETGSKALNRVGDVSNTVDKWGENNRYLKYIWGPWSGMAIGMGTPIAYQAVTGRPFYHEDSIHAYPQSAYNGYMQDAGEAEDEYRRNGYTLPS